mgnify:CR=1 FL=1
MVPGKWSFVFAARVLVVVPLLLAPAASAADSHALGIQAGWWAAEIDYRTPFGLFVDVGVPYNTIAPGIPVRIRRGRRHSGADRLPLRFERPALSARPGHVLASLHRIRVPVTQERPLPPARHRPLSGITCGGSSPIGNQLIAAIWTVFELTFSHPGVHLLVADSGCNGIVDDLSAVRAEARLCI